MCDCATSPLRAACAAHDNLAVATLMAGGVHPECNTCSMIDVALAGRKKAPAITGASVTAQQACILQQLVAGGFTRTTSHGGVADPLLALLRTDPVGTTAFINQESCRCGNQLQSLILAAAAPNPSPMRPCQRCR